jgi:hypothetical protein
MRITLTILVGLSFFSIAVLGFAAMHRGTEHGHHGCIAVIANGLICLKKGSPLAAVIFHLETFKSFSTAIFANNLIMILLVLMLIALAAIFSRRLFLILPACAGRPAHAPFRYSKKNCCAKRFSTFAQIQSLAFSL